MECKYLSFGDFVSLKIKNNDKNKNIFTSNYCITPHGFYAEDEQLKHYKIKNVPFILQTVGWYNKERVFITRTQSSNELVNEEMDIGGPVTSPLSRIQLVSPNTFDLVVNPEYNKEYLLYIGGKVYPKSVYFVWTGHIDRKKHFVKYQPQSYYAFTPRTNFNNDELK